MRFNLVLIVIGVALIIFGNDMQDSIWSSLMVIGGAITFIVGFIRVMWGSWYG